MGPCGCCSDFYDCTAVNLLNISAVSVCKHTVGVTDPNRATLAKQPPHDPPQTSRLSLSGQRLECICVLEHINHPVLNHVVPSCQTHQHAAAGTFNPPPMCTSPDLNTAVALFLFYFIFLFCLYAVQTDDAKINPHIFFLLLIIQYCNIFNIK